MFIQQSYDNACETETHPPRKRARFTLLVGLLLLTQPDFAFSAIARCKYSVRDVAFVNVHGKSWQLELVKPIDVDHGQFEQRNAILRDKLERSNVGYVWHAPESSRGLQILARAAAAKSGLPAMVLSGLNQRMTPIINNISVDSSFADTLDRLLESPGRREVLDNLVEALCVIVLVESENEDANRMARIEVDTAIEQLERQMWTLEKPTDNGPVVVVIPNRQLKDETWLLRSLEFQDRVLPAVAIVYGQGRRLGDVLVGNDLNAKKILGRASICGQDCECRLNRDWLYGQQMIHRWSLDLERAAEQSLSFDPHSSFVIAEVAQIVQKNSTGVPPNDRVDFGSGLVIHDLDHIGEQPMKNGGGFPAAMSKNVTTHDSDTLPPADPKSQNTSVMIPWPLMLGLIVLAFMIIGFLQRKQA